MAEVDHGNLATQRAHARDVKEFAQRMVTDHGKANSELLAIANRKQLKVAPDMGAKHRAMQQKLSGMSGEDFDRHYMKHMVEGHEAAVKLFQTEAKHGKDTDLKHFAEKTLPVIEEHLKMAKSIQERVGGGKTTVNK
jgi:putative membrane protein